VIEEKYIEKKLIYRLSVYLNGVQESQVSLNSSIDIPKDNLFLGSENVINLFQGEF